MIAIQGLVYGHCRPNLRFLFVLFISLFLLGSEALYPQDTLIVRPKFDDIGGARRDIVSFRRVKRPRIGLVLSGGGARGVAHVGVLRALEKYHIPIDLIVGTSIGSLVGGLYAAGYSTDQLQAVIDTTNWADVLSFADESERSNLFVGQKQAADKEMFKVRFEGLTPVIPSSFSSAQRLTTFINQLTLQGIYHPSPSFDDLKVPFRAVATDLISGKRMVLSSGPLAEALRATITVPLLYSPITRDSMELTDGGLISNIPVEVAQDLKMDIIIAVDISSPLRTANQLNAPWEVADQIIGIMAQLANKQSLEKATIVIKPDLGNHLASDFSNLDSLMQKGEETMISAIPALLDSIQTKQASEYSSLSDNRDKPMRISSVSFEGAALPDSTAGNLRSLVHANGVTVGSLQEKLDSMYLSGTYNDSHAELTFHDSTVSIKFVDIDNPEIRSIDITGDSLISLDELTPIVQPLTGKPANANATRGALSGILALYRDRGYSLARVRSIQFDSASGVLHLGIDEGVIAHMTVEGTTKSRDWVIWRELPFTDGDVFTVSNAQRAIANLMSTNLFDQVLIDVRYLNDNNEIVIKATEKKSEVIGLGLRIDNERDAQPSLQIRDENFLGAATELGLGFGGGLRNRTYVFEFKANRIFNSYYTFNLNTYYDLRDIYTYENNPATQSPTTWDRLRIGEYRQIKDGGAFSLGTQVERLGTVTAEYRLELNRINFITGQGYSTDKFTLQTLRLSSIIDTQDEYPFANSGSLMNVSWETASSIVAGDIGYSKLFVSYEWFSTYFDRHTFHPKISFGFADKTLPLSQQFSLGGEDSFYGLYQDDSRGRQIFVINLEYRALLPIKIFWDTYFRVRYDFGSIWPQPENISLNNLHHGIGVGLAVNTPAGKASVSVGRSFFVRRDLLTQPLSLGPVITYLSFGYPL